MKEARSRESALSCNELIDEFIADGQCDAASRYTQACWPVRAIAHMLESPEKARRPLSSADHWGIGASAFKETMVLLTAVSTR